MTTDRLDRIEAILAENAQQLAENARQLVETRHLVESNAAGLRETRAITDSNARAIEAWGERIDEVQIETEEATSSTRADLAVRIEDNAHNQGIDRVRFDQLHEEHSQRFNNLLEEARADRALNESEHRAFRETFQTLLAEISRLWQRVAG
jgi:sugar-specific transcriptional regulator TrmB